MKHDLAAIQPFSFAQTVGFVRSFPPCRGDYVVTDDAITVAVADAGRAIPVTITATAIETTGGARAVQLARDFVGAGDDLRPLYRAAEGDAAFQRVIDARRGLHHVRFLTLEEIAVYAVLMQRTPIAMAATFKRRFLDAFGLPVTVAGHRLRAMPVFADLVELSEADIAAAIGHGAKAARIVEVVRGVAAIGEHTLRTARYDRARDALLAIRGVGPFSAAAILLRGLGRMDDLPWRDAFDDAGRRVYGASFSRRAIERRYGATIGYWSFYCMTSSSVGAAVTVGKRARPSESSMVAV